MYPLWGSFYSVRVSSPDLETECIVEVDLVSFFPQPLRSIPLPLVLYLPFFSSKQNVLN